METSDGRELNYELANAKKVKKYNEKQIQVIKEIQKLNLSLEQSKNILKDKHNMKISRNTINKIWSNNY